MDILCINVQLRWCHFGQTFIFPPLIERQMNGLLQRSALSLTRSRGSFHSGDTDSCLIIVRSPFRAKHHVVVSAVYGKVDEMSPTPLPSPNPPPPCQTPIPHQTPQHRRQGGQGRINDITGRQGTSHCSCLEHCFLLDLLSLLVCGE